MLTIPVPIDVGRLVPRPELFVHRSDLHGQKHVGRVMVHAFRLLEATGQREDAARLWAAVYLHDLARTHDGICHQHGANAVARLESMPGVKALFAEGGVKTSDAAAIAFAVTHHAMPPEPRRDHEYWTLTALLKDADGLDRVRLGDLDASYLRWPQTHQMVDFAGQLLDVSDPIPIGPDFFPALMAAAATLT